MSLLVDQCSNLLLQFPEHSALFLFHLFLFLFHLVPTNTQKQRGRSYRNCSKQLLVRFFLFRSRSLFLQPAAHSFHLSFLFLFQNLFRNLFLFLLILCHLFFLHILFLFLFLLYLFRLFLYHLCPFDHLFLF
eukprot:s7833_g4.t1